MEFETTGLILRGVGGLYEVLLDAAGPRGGERIAARAKGNFRHAGQTPLAGDRVRVLADDTFGGSDGGGAVIAAILPRKNALIRPPLANLDTLFIVFAAAAPDPAPETVDKLIAIAEHAGIEPVPVVTKADLAPQHAAAWCALYRKAGFAAFSLSERTGEGIAAFCAWVGARRAGLSAFAGASGVGKSTLMNALYPSLALATGEISRKTERGRHTTRRVELYAVGEGAFVADTPGFSLLDFVHFDFFGKEDLPHVMREFKPYLGQCRYAKCSHTKEQGCAVLAAVRAGEIAPSRHASYCAMYAALKDKREWNKK